MKRLVATRNTLLIAMFASLSIPEGVNAQSCYSIDDGACVICYSEPYISDGESCVSYGYYCFHGQEGSGTDCGPI